MYLPKASHQIIRAQVCVAFQHPELLVSGDAADLDDVQAALEQTADALVTQVVKA